MLLVFRRLWLSNASEKEFKRGLSWRERLAHWINHKKESLRSRYMFVIIAVAVFILHFTLPLFPPISSALPTASEARSFINTLWPVHAGIVSAIFIVIFFILGTVQRGRPLDPILSDIVRKMYLVPVATFALSSILSEGVSSLLLLEKSKPGGLILPGLGNLLVLDSTFFLLTMIALLYAMWLTLKYVKSSELSQLQLEVADHLAREAVEQQIISEKGDQIFRHWVESSGLSLGFSPGHFHPLMTTKRGYVIDIDLRKIQELGNKLSLTPQPTDEILGKPVNGALFINVGDKITDENCVVAHLPPAADQSQYRVLIELSFKTGSRPSEPREFDQAFTHVLERALQASRDGQRSVIRETLDFYAQGLSSFLMTTHRHGITHDSSVVKWEMSPPPHDWIVRDRILKDCEHLLLQSMNTKDATAYELMKYYPFQLIDIGKERGDHQIFSQAIRYYTKIYTTIQSMQVGREREYREDIRKIWADNLEKILSDMHQSVKKILGNPEKVAQTVRLAQLAQRELFLFSMVAADRRDKGMFKALLGTFSESQKSFWDIDVGQPAEIEKRAKRNYDEERIIGIIVITGMIAFIQIKEGGWKSILSECSGELMRELEVMPNDLSLIAVTNTATDGGSSQWYSDALDFISFQSYDGQAAWLHFEDFVALGSIIGLVKLIKDKRLTESTFVDSLNESAFTPVGEALREITARAERWKEYAGDRGLEVVRSTLKELQRRQEVSPESE
jgi:hypothetical protein